MIKITLTPKQVKKVIEDNKKKEKNAPEEPITYTIIGAARKLGIGKSKIYELIKDGEIKPIMIGKSPRVPLEEINKYSSNYNSD